MLRSKSRFMASTNKNRVVEVIDLEVKTMDSTDTDTITISDSDSGRHDYANETENFKNIKNSLIHQDDENDQLEHFLTISKIFTLSESNKHEVDTGESGIEQVIDEYLLTELQSVSNKENLSVDQHNQEPALSSRRDENRTETNSFHNMPSEIVDKPLIIDLDSCSQNGHNFTPCPSTSGYDHRLRYLDLPQGCANFFPAELEYIMSSDDPPIDFLSDRTPEAAIIAHATTSTLTEPQPILSSVPNTNRQTSNQESLQTPPSLMVLSDYKDTSHNYLDGSVLFPSIEGFQQSYIDCTYPNEQGTGNDHSSNLITDLELCESCENATDSGIFGMSFSDNLSHEFCYPDVHPSGCQNGLLPNQVTAEYINQEKGEIADPSHSLTHSNTPEYGTEQSSHHLSQCGNHRIEGQHVAEVQKCLSNVNMSLHHSKSTVTTFEQSPHSSDSISNLYYSKYQSYDSCYYQAMSNLTNVGQGNWNFVEKHQNIFPTSNLSKHPYNQLWSPSSSSFREDAITPDIVHFLKTEVKEDDEETDDADEVPMTQTFYAPVMNDTGVTSHGSPRSDYTCSQHSLVSLTPPPSTSGTPVPPSSHESMASDKVGLFSPLPSDDSLIDSINNKGTTLILPSSKLSTEILKPGLRHYELNQNTKCPFPSMADAMRSTRASRQAGTKSYKETKSSLQSGRPRKSLIQSDKISTSTAKNTRGRKKATKPGVDAASQADPDNRIQEAPNEAACGSGSNRSRHNEPLNQQAIDLMLRWFRSNMDNPYPSKQDKEAMAQSGGITENQVKSWFANKRNRTNNTKPKVQKRAMEEKLKELFKDLKKSHHNPMADNSHIIQQLSGIIQHCHNSKQE